VSLIRADQHREQRLRGPIIDEGDGRPVVVYFRANEYPANFKDGDRRTVIDALERQGVRVVERKWGDTLTEEELAHVDFAYLGSPWDDWGRNMPRFLRFVRNLEAHGVPISNPWEVVKAGADKSYLWRLSRRRDGRADTPAARERRRQKGTDVKVVPTDMYRYQDRGLARGPKVEVSGTSQEERRVNRLFRIQGVDYDEIVIKPGSSGGTLDTARFKRSQWREALAHMQKLHAGVDTGDNPGPPFPQDVIVQPYREVIEREREKALVILNGTFSHAFIKDPILEEGAGPDDPHAFHPNKQPYDPTTEEIEHAERAYAELKKMYGWKDKDLIAVRIDMIGDEMLEAEMIAPVKGFNIKGMMRDAVDRFAGAIAGHARRHLAQRLGRSNGVDIATPSTPEMGGSAGMDLSVG
jgi:hypothetical protein